MFMRLFSSPAGSARGQAGWRAYAVGDVHGCLALLDDLLERIAADHAARPPAKGLLVLLGDLIDRGPATAQVLDRMSALNLPGFKLVALAGNHEEVLRRILDGDDGQVASWLTFGGKETLASYGLDAEPLTRMAPDDARERIAAAIPRKHRDYLRTLADSLRFGDYLFVHAGIRPGVAIDQQSLLDLRWIREPFLSDRRDHGVVVVHGHTISETVEEAGSRIGIDTGAYATGRLTALGIDGDQRWVIDTVDGLHQAEAAFV